MPPKKKKGVASQAKKIPSHDVEDFRPDDLLELKTIYEGPGGKRSSRLLHKTTIIVTNRTVEIEREGANVWLTLLTLGCWYFCFQTASIEIYELNRISSLYLKDDVIIGEVSRSRCGANRFELDTPANGELQTKDLFFELKDAWNIARHGVMAGDDLLGDLDEDGDSLLLSN
jgi:cbb3-type cytochrome oxidase subunit 3